MRLCFRNKLRNGLAFGIFSAVDPHFKRISAVVAHTDADRVFAVDERAACDASCDDRRRVVEYRRDRGAFSARRNGKRMLSVCIFFSVNART